MKNRKIISKSFLFSLLLIFSINSYSQTGLNFQGVARTTNNIILASQSISIRLTILRENTDGTKLEEYVETRKVNTNAQGLFSIVIGDTGTISKLGNFATINWRLSPKFLKIEMDPTGGNNFITMGTTQFQYVAYAQFAKSVDAENIVGIIPVTLGGTGVNSLTGLKSALALDKLNNTADTSKPISVLMQASLDSKLNKSDTSKYTKQTYTDSALLTKLSTTGNAATATTAGNITATNNTTLTSLSNLATVGTITSGVWSGTVVSVEKGGTGLNVVGSSGQVLTSTNSGTMTWTSPPEGSVHFIGESYGGGIVFYVYDGGRHGLIAATSDQSTGIRWYGGTYVTTRARGNGVGAGLKNTAIIIATQAGVYTPTYDINAFAASVCNEYTATDGDVIYADWYLPSLHELNLLYAVKHLVGGIDNSVYWSSTERLLGSIWVKSLGTGLEYFTNSNTNARVNAIRTF